MDYKNAGRPVTVEEMMAFRDTRAEIQSEMLAAHHLPVISFSMNIPGEIKTDECIRRAFDEGLKTLRNCLESGVNAVQEPVSGDTVNEDEEGSRPIEEMKADVSEEAGEGYAIVEEREMHENAGDQWIAAVNAPAKTLKEMATSIEETHPYGRLFDMDVLDEEGNKLSRAVPRRCLICNKEAAVCARSRRHDLSQLKNAVDQILGEL